MKTKKQKVTNNQCHFDLSGNNGGFLSSMYIFQYHEDNDIMGA